MLSRKFVLAVFSLLVVTSLLLAAAVQSTEAQGSAPVTNAEAPAPGETPHYYGPYPNWANSPQVLTNAIVTIASAAPVPGPVGNSLVDRAYATDFVAQPPVTPASVSPAAAHIYNVNVGSATGGSFTLTVDAATTASIAFNASAADVEAALVAAGVPATVSGSGSIADPWVITFATAPTSVTIDGAGLTQAVADSAVNGADVIYNVNVGSATGGSFTLTVDAATTTSIAFNAVAADVEAALVAAGVTATVTGSGSIADPWVITFVTAPTSVTLEGAGLTQAVADSAVNGVTTAYNVHVGTAIGGTFTLTVDALSTAPIAWNALAADVEAALVAAGVTATVTGSGSIADPWVIAFSVPPTSMTIDGAGLTQATNPVPVLVVVPTALPNGTLQAFRTWNQATAGGSPTPSAGQSFHAYILRLVAGTTDQYEVVFDSGTLTVPPLANPGTSAVATFPMADIPVVEGDVIAFYGSGIPVDTGAGADIFSFPAPNAPVEGNTITVGDAATFPIYAQARTYSFAATVTPTDPGTGAEATATVNPKTGAISAITVINPGSGYLVPPVVTITSPGITPTALASAKAVISSGVITSIAVVESGFGFTTPEVTITGGNPTAGFTATAVASGGVDDLVLTSGGGGYTIQPVVEFSLPNLPGGIQATGSATMDANGVVNGVAVVDPGSGYTSAPTVTIWDGDFTLAAATPATAVATIGIGQIDVVSGGQGYDTVPTVDIVDLGGTSVVPASAEATIAVLGAVTAINVTQPGAGYLTPGLKKFVDTLPGLGPTAANNLGQYIPVAVPDTTTYPGSDYYEIAVVQYRMKFHSDLPPTLLRGYIQLSTSVVPGKHVALGNANLDPALPDTPILLPDGSQAYGADNPHYLGPTIVATKDRPVRILFRNLLPTGEAGDLFLPVDSTLMGAGPGPTMMTLDANGVPIEMFPDEGTVEDRIRNPMCNETPKPEGCFADNRSTLHNHGAITPWISDGTPHQWTTPAGEDTPYPKGVSTANVPDMPDPGPGAMTFFYTNQQSARLLFYHDHAWGITRLNVYAGEAAPYLITDDMEQQLIGAGGALAGLGVGTPLVIQDKTFLPSPEAVAQQDPTWNYDRWGGEGSLWAPHVYMPAQNPSDPTGMSAFGRWMYGPFFWPPANADYPPIANPYYDPACDPDVEPFCEPALIPGTPNISVGMEAFNDTPLVNGAAYPTTTVEPKAYRYRILNAANDRFWNLSWYVADPRTGTLSEVALNPAELEAAQTDPVVFPTPDLAWSPKGPNWIQIGTEGGFLPAPVVIPAQPTTWITDPTRFDVGNVDQHSLLLAPAERADVIVDFSQFRGKTLILYNDAPAAFPARVPGYDYYTGGPDLSPSGAPTTLPGYGPNTRTIMQVKVSNGAPAVAFDRPGTTADRLGALMTAFAHKANGSGVFESSQNPITVGQAAYNSAYGTNFAASGWCSAPSNPSAKCDGYARISEQGGDLFKFDTLDGAQLAIPLEPKGIHDEMNSANFDEFGRMTANIGLEAPGATPLLQNIILYPYVNPATEVLDATGMPSSLDVTPISSAADGTQIWKITHNGVDTHPIHFHLYDIQLINRVAWDNIISPPDPNELGWKDTVRVNPLQDTYVAIRPIVPVLPFAIPDSIRPLNPMMPLGARGTQAGQNGQEAGFNNTDALGQPIAPIINEMTNFFWEYVWHCHILSHEEMDMMRPQSVYVDRLPPDAPVLTFTRGSVILHWTDGTPVDYADPTTWGNIKNEIGFRVERAQLDVNGQPGDYTVLTTTLANVTTYTDDTTIPGWSYSYRVIAFNAADDESPSNVLEVLTLPPSDPTNLVATAVSFSEVDLTWADNATTETGYDIERCTGAGCTDFARIDGVGTDINVYSDADVLPNTTYTYRVVAFNMGGKSNPSNEDTVTTADAPAATPTNLTATAISASQVDLAWADNASNETGFRIERALVTGGTPGTFFPVGTQGVNATSYSDMTAVPNTTYAYRVFALSATGDSPASNTAIVTTPDITPAAPDTLAAIAINPNQVNLTWADNSANENNFRVERCTGAGCTNFAALPLGTLGANTTSFSDMTVAASTTYVYRVFALNAIGDSQPSNTATVTTPSLLPAAPSNLVVTAVSSTQINLTWTDNASNETGFTIQRSTNAAFTKGLNTITLNAANQTVYTNTGRQPNTTYFYRVRAFNAVGFSDWSNVASAFTANPLSPAAPSNLAAAAFSKSQIDLTWTDNATNETGFTVQRSTNINFTGTTTITLNAIDQNSYSNTGLKPNTTYYYRVRAFNAVGPSAWSNTAFATTFALAPPAAPSDLVATAIGPRQINLTWTDNATNETGFRIQRSTNANFNGGNSTYTLNAVDQTAYSNTTARTNTTYYYRVQAFNADGSSAWSNVVSATTPNAIPAVPAGLTVAPPAAPAGRTSLVISWTYTPNSNPGPITFQVQRSNTGTGGWTTVANGISATTFTNGGLPVNTLRYYRVRAISPTGNSAWTTVVSGRTLP